MTEPSSGHGFRRDRRGISSSCGLLPLDSLERNGPPLPASRSCVGEGARYSSCQAAYDGQSSQKFDLTKSRHQRRPLHTIILATVRIKWRGSVRSPCARFLMYPPPAGGGLIEAK